MSALTNPVGWFELYVQDMARAKAFYEKVFVRTMSDLPLPGADYLMCVFDSEPNGKATGATGALVQHPKMKPGSGGTLIYFMCTDCAVEAQRAKEFGGAVHEPKRSIGQYGFIAIVGDTEGNVIGLHSMQ